MKSRDKTLAVNCLPNIGFHTGKRQAFLKGKNHAAHLFSYQNRCDIHQKRTPPQPHDTGKSVFSLMQHLLKDRRVQLRDQTVHQTSHGYSGMKIQHALRHMV